MNNTKYISGNILTLLLYRITLSLLFFSLCRVGFLVYNLNLFPAISTGELFMIFKGGIVFDLSAAAYINLLFIFLQIIPLDIRYNRYYQLTSEYIYYLTNGLAVSLNGMDYVYFRFADKRATADVFKTFEGESNLFELFFRFLIDYWQASLFTLILLALMVYLYRIRKAILPRPSNRIAYYSLNVLAVPLVVFLLIGAARGGYKHSTRPITISNATKYVESPQNIAIVLNTPFSLIRTWGKRVLVRQEFFDEERLKELYNPSFKPPDSTEFRPDNVVILILESFAREYIGSLNTIDMEKGYEGYTPFLDSLIAESLTFEVSISNGRKSIDAIPSVLASVPSLETPYIISHYANNDINGLPALLKKKGYYTAFFHGAPNGSMGFDSFTRLAGFDNYYGRDQYPDKEDFDGTWGIWDEPYLKYFASELDSFKEPFLASVFTISSHHPFLIPDEHRNRFKKGPIPILETIGYADFSLRGFFEEAKESSWFENTLFVITADHTNESIHKEYQNALGVYSIPIIFYKPGGDLKGMSNRIAQQIDIMPSVLSYLGYDQEYFAFGNNLFDTTGDSFAFNTSGGTYRLYMENHLLEMIDALSVAFYNYKTDRFLENNLVEERSDLLLRMEDKLKAIKQTYSQSLLDNKMVIRK